MLQRIVEAWDEPAFENLFKAEMEQLRHEQLPLQQGLTLSSYVSDEPFRVMVISRRAEDERLHIKAGVFYSGVIAGCSCADDPTPQDLQAEYCDIEVVIDPRSGEATIRLLSE